MLPPSLVPTLKLYVVLPTPDTPQERFSAIATTCPVFGTIIVIAPSLRLLSLRGMNVSTADCADFCVAGTSVVRMVRPPRLSSASRAAGVAPKAVFVRSCR